MRTKLCAEIDELLAFYLIHHKDCLPSRDFPHIFKLLESIKDIENDCDRKGGD